MLKGQAEGSSKVKVQREWHQPWSIGGVVGCEARNVDWELKMPNEGSMPSLGDITSDGFAKEQSSSEAALGTRGY